MSSVYDNLTIHSSSVVYIFHKGIFFFKSTRWLCSTNDCFFS